MSKPKKAKLDQFDTALEKLYKRAADLQGKSGGNFFLTHVAGDGSFGLNASEAVRPLVFSAEGLEFIQQMLFGNIYEPHYSDLRDPPTGSAAARELKARTRAWRNGSEKLKTLAAEARSAPQARAFAFWQLGPGLGEITDANGTGVALLSSPWFQQVKAQAFDLRAAAEASLLQGGQAAQADGTAASGAKRPQTHRQPGGGQQRGQYRLSGAGQGQQRQQQVQQQGQQRGQQQGQQQSAQEQQGQQEMQQQSAQEQQQQQGGDMYWSPPASPASPPPRLSAPASQQGAADYYTGCLVNDPRWLQPTRLGASSWALPDMVVSISKRSRQHLGGAAQLDKRITKRPVQARFSCLESIDTISSLQEVSLSATTETSSLGVFLNSSVTSP